MYAFSHDHVAHRIVRAVHHVLFYVFTLHRISLPSIIDVTAVLALVFVLYAILLVEFFGLTRYGQYGNDQANFRNFQNAVLMMIRMTTGGF